MITTLALLLTAVAFPLTPSENLAEHLQFLSTYASYDELHADFVKLGWMDPQDREQFKIIAKKAGVESQAAPMMPPSVHGTKMVWNGPHPLQMEIQGSSIVLKGQTYRFSGPHSYSDFLTRLLQKPRPEYATRLELLLWMRAFAQDQGGLKVGEDAQMVVHAATIGAFNWQNLGPNTTANRTAYAARLVCVENQWTLQLPQQFGWNTSSNSTSTNNLAKYFLATRDRLTLNRLAVPADFQKCRAGSSPAAIQSWLQTQTQQAWLESFPRAGGVQGQPVKTTR